MYEVQSFMTGLFTFHKSRPESVSEYYRQNVIRLRSEIANLYRDQINNTMKTALNLFSKQSSKQLKNIEIETIVYERNDDGLLLECLVDTQDGKIRQNLEVDFYQWEFVLAHIKDSFLANRLEKMVANMVDSVDWISELPLKQLLGRRAQLRKLNTNAQYHVLRA